MKENAKDTVKIIGVGLLIVLCIMIAAMVGLWLEYAPL